MLQKLQKKKKYNWRNNSKRDFNQLTVNVMKIFCDRSIS